MTRNNILNKTKSKLILALLLICMICMSLFTFAACDNTKDDTKDTDTNYTYSESNETLISNSYFAYGTADVKLTAYPKSSVTGWTKKAETDMTSSSSKYGVIDVSDEGWTNLVSKLYDDSYFLNFFKIKYDFEESDVKTALDKTNPTSAEIKKYIIDNYFNSTEVFKYPENTTAVNEFKNPKTHEGAKDNKVYMLGNYLSKDNVGRGTAQKITSSSTITLKKGEYGKVSVWVKTQNVSGLGVDYGANIRLSNTFNSSSQADFGIYNIVDKEWTKYTLFVKADDTYTTTFTLTLGLGADKLSATEGTVYFDDVEFEHITSAQYAEAIKAQTVTTKFMNYEADETLKINASDLTKSGSNASPVLYDMTLNTYLENNVATYKVPVDISNVVKGYTTTNKVSDNGEITGKRFEDSSASVETTSINGNAHPYADNALKATLNKASYTISFNKNTPITVGAKSYAYVEFFVKNQLNKFTATGVTVDVFDILGENVKKRAAVASISEANDEWAKIGLIIKNNFETGDRQFYFDIVIGPTDVAASDFALDYATGEVLISQPTISTGSVNKFIDEDSDEITENYDLYSLFSSTASGKVDLYAGNPSDSVEQEETEETYDLSVAPSDVETIKSAPAIPQGYKGIVSNHFYITDSADAETSINTSTTSGLINTKYLANYSTSKYGDIAAKLNGAYKADENIQPLMIYNPTATSYGYIGESKTIAASSKAKFEVTLRVTDSAKAYVYLIDTSSAVKEIATFKDFTVNADVYGNAISDGKALVGDDMKLYFEVDSTKMEEDGWVTVEFNVLAGATAQNLRLEIWNGTRDGKTTSTGHVFVKDAHAHTNNGFTDAPNSKTTWTTAGTPLFDVGEKDLDELYIHKRPLTDTEKKFNSEQTDATKKVSYDAKYIWARNDSMIYAIYDTIDPIEKDPYANQAEDDKTEENASGCTAETDPSTFWLSFSSILLGVALAVAIIMLIIKNVVRRRKANASDAKSHYKVTSRTRPQKKSEPVKETAEEPVTEESTETIEEVSEEEMVENTTEETSEEGEKTLDEYVYGDVQDFGETESSEEKEQTNESEENN